jgi:hypothetical protein
MFTPIELAFRDFATIELTDDPDFFSAVVAKKLEELYQVCNSEEYQEPPVGPYLKFFKSAILKEQRFCLSLKMNFEPSERAGLLKLIKNSIAEKQAHINLALITVANWVPTLA